MLVLMLCYHPLEILFFFQLKYSCPREILNPFVLGPVNYTAGPAEAVALALEAVDLGLEPASLGTLSASGLARSLWLYHFPDTPLHTPWYCYLTPYAH